MEENKMKKFLATILAASMALSLAACGGSAELAAPAQPAEAPAQSEEAPAEAGYTGASYALQLGHIGAEGSAEDIVANRFKELVEAETDGKITVEVFGNSQMGGLNDMCDALRYDTLDMCISNMAYNSYVPRVDVISLPYLFSNNEHLEAYLESDSYQAMCDEVAEKCNAKTLGTINTGFRVILSNKKIKTADDMNGIAIRVPEAPAFVKTFSALGCNTTILPATDVYQALQTGLVTATEANPVFMVSMNYHEVSKYCVLTNHIATTNNLMISASKYDSMDAEAQAILDEAAKTAVAEANTLVQEQADEAYAAMEAAGVTMVEPDSNSFKTVMQNVWPELGVDDMEGGREMLEEILALDPNA